MHEYLLYSFGHNLLLLLFILLFSLSYIWTLGTPNSIRHTLCIIPIFFEHFLTYFPAYQNIPGIPCIFSSQYLGQTISTRSPDSFNWKMCFRNQIWMLVKCILLKYFVEKRFVIFNVNYIIHRWGSHYSLMIHKWSNLSEYVITEHVKTSKHDNILRFTSDILLFVWMLASQDFHMRLSCG